jgi:hypothetical protein
VLVKKEKNGEYRAIYPKEQEAGEIGTEWDASSILHAIICTSYYFQAKGGAFERGELEVGISSPHP